MEWFWIVAAAGSALFAARWWRDRQSTRRTQAEEFEGVRRLAAEDVAHLGEQLQLLDREVGGQVLDEQARVAHQSALESYASARRTLSQVSKAEEVSNLTHTVATGRNALALVHARIAGLPVPEQRLMCFFDPQHGPSGTEVLWHRPGHGARRVPACAQDADRLADKQAPEVRTVQVGARTMPYWAAGTAFLPYIQGYFADAAVLSWAVHPAAFDKAADAGQGYFGTGIVGSSGNFDGGGFDGSGAGGL